MVFHSGFKTYASPLSFLGNSYGTKNTFFFVHEDIDKAPGPQWREDAEAHPVYFKRDSLLPDEEETSPYASPSKDFWFSEEEGGSSSHILLAVNPDTTEAGSACNDQGCFPYNLFRETVETVERLQNINACEETLKSKACKKLGKEKPEDLKKCEAPSDLNVSDSSVSGTYVMGCMLGVKSFMEGMWEFAKLLGRGAVGAIQMPFSPTAREKWQTDYHAKFVPAKEKFIAFVKEHFRAEYGRQRKRYPEGSVGDMGASLQVVHVYFPRLWEQTMKGLDNQVEKFQCMNEKARTRTGCMVLSELGFEFVPAMMTGGMTLAVGMATRAKQGSRLADIYKEFRKDAPSSVSKNGESGTPRREARTTEEIVEEALEKVGGDDGTSLLRQLAQAESPSVRKQAAIRAGKLGGDEGAALLRHIATDDDWQVRMEVAEQAGRLRRDDAAALLRQLATDANDSVRMEVATQARMLGGDEGAALLRQLATDADASVRMEVAEQARMLGGDEGAALLRQLATDANDSVRKVVATQAGMLGGDEGAAILRQLVKDSDYSVRMEVAEQARMLGGNEGYAIWYYLTKGKAPPTGFKTRLVKENKAKEKVEEALGKERKEGATLLRQLVQAEEPRVRVQAVRGAGMLGGDEGAALLRQLATDKSFHVRTQVAKQAGMLGGDEGAAILRQLATDESSVRVWVARGAGMLGGDEGTAILRQLATDEHKFVRMQVARGGRELGGDEGVAILRQLATDTDASVRKVVATQAGMLGGDEGAALLRQLATDADASVRQEVATQARKLRGDEGTAILRQLATDENIYVRQATK